ncbi:hypothetical protein PQE70_gp010 [Bacillus phage vB_BanS_Nate]|uniref:Uncharacterized protein n=1 Tax=Bacillus phage vB_BanS_Nate TaxID=2894788 RepID=A0AAE8YU58_9CAUD|nr:hypothetical protein PQE70_gp010 [Bacillus phage vB_BanS_Nate]UGO50863.1 hypothetical protein NATE_10 [Bacillus phage vB_BanS_Nate]
MVNYQMRNGIVMVLQEAMRKWNSNEDIKMIKHTLIKINETEGYSVKMLEEEREIDGTVYKLGDAVFEIFEDGQLLFSAYRDKKDDMFVLESYAVDLLTQNELKDEAEFLNQLDDRLICC